jgi:DNA-directed RNA polymerase specialized sigma54-like protein
MSSTVEKKAPFERGLFMVEAGQVNIAAVQTPGRAPPAAVSKSGGSMTPQLQLAIQMIALPQTELAAELKRLAAENPALTLSPPGDWTLPWLGADAESPRPDVIVVREAEGYKARLDEGALPVLAVRRDAIEEARGALQEGASAAVTEQLRGAVWIMRCLEQRQKTILRFAEALVAREGAFFAEGPEWRVKIPVRALSEELGIHTQTVARIAEGKRLRCDHGAYPLDSFLKGLRRRRPKGRCG